MEQINVLVVFAGVFATVTLCQWVAWKLKLPAIIFLLLAGLLSGPVFHLLEPEDLMGQLYFPFVSLSVAIILFEGSLTLKIRDIFHIQRVVRNMLTVGLVITWLVTTLSARWLTGVGWELACLFGAITVVTGPTVIAPLLRSVRPVAPVANILRWEGIVIDPIGASFSVLVYEFIVSGGGGAAWGHTLITFLKITSVGFCTGIACGYLFGLVLRNYLIPEFLQNVATLSVVFVSFVFANFFQEESGLITVTVIGVWLANMKGVDLETILRFKEDLSVLLVSLLFIMLASQLEVSAFKEIGWAVLFVFLAVQLLARPLNIMVSALGSDLSMNERHLLSWIAPRGIVAAAIASLFSIGLQRAGVADAHLLVPLTFTVIIGTVLLQSFTAGPLAKLLKVAEPEPTGFIIVGGNLVGRAIAKALTQVGVRVVIADSIRENIQAAAESGIENYRGNPLSEHADRHLNMTGIGRLLALSPYENANFAAIMHFKKELGKDNVFFLRSVANGSKKSRDKLYQRLSKRKNRDDSSLSSKDLRFVPSNNNGRLLFGKEVTYQQLFHALLRGGAMHKIEVLEETDMEFFMEHIHEHMLPMFWVDQKKNVHVVTVDASIQPEEGWVVIGLVNELAEPTDSKVFVSESLEREEES